MCVEGCMELVRDRLTSANDTSSSNNVETDVSRDNFSRRGFLKGLATSAVASATLATVFAEPALAMEDKKRPKKKRMLKRGIRKVVDLTHTFDSAFPTYGGSSGIEKKSLASFDKVGFNIFEYKIFEHAGTHMDAPLHVTRDGKSVDEIEPEQLVVPLVVVDLRARANRDADTQLTPDDLRAWEKKNGKIPDNACVAMDSGWSEYVNSKKYRNADDEGTMHFPGFHKESADFLLNDRNVAGIAVDTLSLDYGASKDFATHYAWLPQGKWGLECVANLSQLPRKGAVLIAGAPKWRGGTGGLTRILALI